MARPLATLPLAVVAACATTTSLGHFNDTVTYTGLWFADAECMRRFAAPRVIRSNEMAAFEKCIATLDLRPGKRKHPLPDGAVMVYGPELEVRVRYLETDTVRLLTSIGFASDHRPTITPAALEALRISGSPQPVLDEAAVAQVKATITPPAKRAFMFVRVCLDDNGAVGSVTPVMTSSLALVGLLDRSIADWKFKPFQWQGVARGVCAIIALVHPMDTPAVDHIPLSSADSPYPVVTWIEHTGESRPRITDSMMMALFNTRPRVTGVVRYCIDESGAVLSADVVEPSGSRAFDDALVSLVRSWTISPYLVDGKPVRVCSHHAYSVGMGRPTPRDPRRR